MQHRAHPQNRPWPHQATSEHLTPVHPPLHFHSQTRSACSVDWNDSESSTWRRSCSQWRTLIWAWNGRCQQPSPRMHFPGLLRGRGRRFAEPVGSCFLRPRYSRLRWCTFCPAWKVPNNDLLSAKKNKF